MLWCSFVSAVCDWREPISLIAKSIRRVVTNANVCQHSCECESAKDTMQHFYLVSLAFIQFYHFPECMILPSATTQERTTKKKWQTKWQLQSSRLIFFYSLSLRSLVILPSPWTQLSGHVETVIDWRMCVIVFRCLIISGTVEIGRSTNAIFNIVVVAFVRFSRRKRNHQRQNVHQTKNGDNTKANKNRGSRGCCCDTTTTTIRGTDLLGRVAIVIDTLVCNTWKKKVNQMLIGENMERALKFEHNQKMQRI